MLRFKVKCCCLGIEFLSIAITDAVLLLVGGDVSTEEDFSGVTETTVVSLAVLAFGFDAFGLYTEDFRRCVAAGVLTFSLKMSSSSFSMSSFFRSLVQHRQ